MGTIGNCMKSQAKITLAESTNKHDFLQHLMQVKAHLRAGVEKPYLVLDNATVHKAASC